MLEIGLATVAVVVGWLGRGALSAYRQRKDLSVKDMVIVFLGGGPGGRDR
jgi:hypothetical protein